MRILCIGDVVGSIGCEFLRNNLPTLKKVKGVDFVICNGENSAGDRRWNRWGLILKGAIAWTPFSFPMLPI